MTLPNLLNMAMTLIPPVNITYEKWQSNTTNSVGYEVASYGEPMQVKASVQSNIPAEMYQTFQLDLNKNYRLIDVPAFVVGTAEQMTPDRITYQGKKWIVVKCNNWHSYNGWVKLLVVEEKDYDG